jgi:IS1 family transposase
MRFLGTPPKTATAPAALSSKTARTVVRIRCPDPEPRGYSEEEKEKIIRAYRERGSKRVIGRIFGVSRYRFEPVARKKGRRADSVADGLQPARDDDILELDECWTYVRKRSNKRWLWVALCLSAWQVVANAQGDRSAKTCARLWSRIPRSHSSKATGKAGASVTSGNPTAQCSKKTQHTGKLESLAASLPMWSGFSDVFGRS